MYNPSKSSVAANDTHPIFSPDGTKILYLSDKTGSSGIWVMGADGKTKAQLTTDPTDSYPVEPRRQENCFLLCERKKTSNLCLYSRS